MKTQGQPKFADEGARDESAAGEADGKAELRRHDKPPAKPRGGEVGGERDHRRHTAAKAEAGDETQHRKVCRRVRQGGERREDAENRGAGDEHRLAADPIAEETRDERPREHSERAGGEGLREGRGRRLPGLDKRRNDIADRSDVETLERHDDHTKPADAEAQRRTRAIGGWSCIGQGHALESSCCECV
jgi:hypothetical protein